MKTIKYIAILATVASLSACEQQPGDDVKGIRTEAGAVIYEQVSSAISQNVAVATLAQRVDEYINVETEGQRDSIKRLHLSKYEIEIDGRLVKLTGGVIWTFDTQGGSLQKPDAQWSVEAHYSEPYPSEGRVVIPTDGYQIRRVNQTTLKLAIKGHKTSQFSASGNLIVSYANAVTNDLTLYNVVGNGIMSTPEKALLVDYNIGVPLLKNSKDSTFMMSMNHPAHIDSPFVKGAINMEVVQASGSINVVADLRKSSLARVVVTIEMGGVVEDWIVRHYR